MGAIKQGLVLMMQAIVVSVLGVFAGENIDFAKKTVLFSSQDDLKNGIMVTCTNSG